MTRNDGAPLRYAWLTIAGLLLVGVAVALGVAVLSSGSGGPAASPTDPPDGDVGDPDSDPDPDSNGAVTAPAGDASPAAPATLRALHRRGYTGENVSVGVVDVTGFDPTDPAIRDRVRAARSFGAEGGIGNGDRTAHGTAAASIVTRVAPDADLYLANFDSPRGFRRAVAWLLRQDVDVIVAPVSFYGQPDDGSSAVARAATRASERGVTFVAPVGNLGRGHWDGRYRPADGGYQQFVTSGTGGGTAPTGTGFPAGARNPVYGDDRRFALWLSWDGAHADENYTAVLHRWNGSTSEVVARSRPYREDEAPNERIVASLSPGRYFVTVRGPNRSTGASLELTSPTHRLGWGSAEGSVAAPATARRVVAVGAYDRIAGDVAAFSSRGPTADGRPGVDVVAPGRFRVGNETRLVGSSAAAPYVAGVAALLRSVAPGIPPARVEAALELTAADVARPGFDYASGYGLVAPVRAVGRLAGDRPVVPAAGNGTGTGADTGGATDPDGRTDPGDSAAASDPADPGDGVGRATLPARPPAGRSDPRLPIERDR